MQDVLVAYATVEGQTGRIASFIRDEVEKTGRRATLFDVSDETATAPLDGVDTVILAAPVHQRRHPNDFEVFVAGNRDALAARRTLMISVSLSAAFPEGVEEAGEYLTEMKMRTGFEPDAEALVAGAIRTSQYDYFATQVVRHVVLRGRDPGIAEGEHEFTDWDALAARVAGFLSQAEA